MSETAWLKHRWKAILNIVTVAALVALMIAVRHQLLDTLRNFSRVNVSVLLLLVPIEWVNYDAQARMYYGLFALVGNNLRYRFLFETSLELNFINNVFPSGGLSGISYFGVRMRGGEITAGRATVVQMMKLVLLFASFEILLIFGMLCIAIGGRVNDLALLLGASLTTLLIVGTLAFVTIIGSEKRINASMSFVTNVLNRLIHFVRPHHPETINTERVRRLVEELHQNYKLISSNWRALQRPFWWSLIANASEVAAVYAVYVAFGHWVNPGSVILAYAVANFAGLVSVMPGGVGIYEALMTGVLVATGVPAALSLPVTVMYRILNMLIQLPPGYYFYHRTLQRRTAG